MQSLIRYQVVGGLVRENVRDGQMTSSDAMLHQLLINLNIREFQNSCLFRDITAPRIIINR